MGYENLLSSYQIGTIALKNRMVMPPMQTSYADSKGFITDRQIDYYLERAKGGVGLIIFEHTGISTQGKASGNMTLISTDAHISGFTKLIDAVHNEGVKVVVQINHAGRQTSSKTTGIPIVAPSAIPDPVQKEMPWELSVDEIHTIVEAFSQAALRVKKSGADGVEIHMAHGYLLGEFLSPFANKRKDEYGGDLQKRAKAPVEVLRAVRKEVGPKFPIICRLSGDEFVEGGNGLENTKKIAQILEKEGVDLFDISAALGGRPFNQLTYYADEGALFYLAQGIKSVVHVPVIGVGRVIRLDVAERILREGKADLVALGRTLIADPYMPRKMIDGNVEDVVYCISCNRCLQSLATGPLTCAVNPQVGREKETRLIPTSKPKKVLVIGGGPSGMKAAEIAARRGHHVTLYERSQNLGGALRLAATPPKKEIMLTIIDYLQRQLIQLQVSLIMNQEVSPQLVDEIKADVVIVATGARPYLPAGIKGIRDVGVLTPEQVLSETANLGQKVAVVGAGGIGAELADYLSESGKDVTLIEMREDIAMDIPSHLQYHLLKRLREKDVRILTSTRAIEFRRGTITIQDGMGKRTLKGFDSIVTALGAKPDDRIARALKAKKIKLHTIGDAKEPGEIREALTDGENVALSL